MPLIHKEVSPHGDWIIYMNGVPLYKRWPSGRSVLFDKYGSPISNSDRDAMPPGDPATKSTETSAMDQIQHSDERVQPGASSQRSAAPANPFRRLGPDALARMISGLLADNTSHVELVARATHLFLAANSALNWKQDENLAGPGFAELRDHLSFRAVLDLSNPEIHPTMPSEVRIPVREYLHTLHGFRPELGYKQTQTTLDEHGVAEMQLTKLLGSLYGTYSHLFDGSAIEDPHLSDPLWIRMRLRQLDEARAGDPIPDDIMETAAKLDFLRGGAHSLDIADALHAERKRWQDEIERLRKAADYIAPYLRWTISDESPGYHPTMPSAVAAFHASFDIDTPEKRIARVKASTKITSRES